MDEEDQTLHDAADARRLLEVRPPDWVNPRATGTYNLVVLGGGTAGLVAAAATAGLGGRVALIEKHELGGDCLNTGCVPSKALLHSAKLAAGIGRAAAAGILVEPPRIDFAAVMRRVRELRADIAPADGAARFRALGVEVFFGEGRFCSPRELAVGGQTLRFARALIATGASPAIPAIPGLAEAGYLTSESVFELRERPRRLVVIGGGPIGVELAQAFCRLGAAVTVVEQAAHLLPREEADVAAIIECGLRREGVALELGASIRRIDADRRVVLHAGGAEKSLAADAILVATGRAPRVENLGLELAGVMHTPRGIVVDDRLRTTNRRIFASGDVAGSFQFTHAADEMSRLIVKNALFFGRSSVRGLVIPRVTYCEPEIAAVGLTEAQARARGLAIETIERSFAEVDRAVLEGATEGLVRVHVEAGRDRIVGASIVGAHAGELIGELTLAIANGLGLGAVARTTHAYPTLALALRQVADAHQRKRLTPRVARLLRWILARRR